MIIKTAHGVVLDDTRPPTELSDERDVLPHCRGPAQYVVDITSSGTQVPEILEDA
jgi:hypothetical protein